MRGPGVAAFVPRPGPFRVPGAACGRNTMKTKSRQEGCLCGCGAFPKSRRGRWLQGHDAKHKSQLLHQVRHYADWGAADELIRRKWLHPVAAVAGMVEGLARCKEFTTRLP